MYSPITSSTTTLCLFALIVVGCAGTPPGPGRSAPATPASSSPPVVAATPSTAPAPQADPPPTSADPAAPLGGGPPLELASGVAFDASRSRALVLDWEANALVAVDLRSGDRLVVSGGTPPRGDGPELQHPRALSLGGAESHAWVLCYGRILDVDLTTGARALVSGWDTATMRFSDDPPPQDVRGTGPALKEPKAITWDRVRSRLVVADRELGALLAVGLSSGDRTVLSSAKDDAPRGKGPKLMWPIGILMDAPKNRVLVADEAAGFFAVDLGSGDRARVVTEELSHNSWQWSGTGPDPNSVGALAPGHATGSAYLVGGMFGSGGDKVIALDLAKGDRRLVAELPEGADRFTDVAAGPGGVLFVSGGHSVWRVEMGAGQTSLLSGARAAVEADDGER